MDMEEFQNDVHAVAGEKSRHLCGRMFRAELHGKLLL